MDRNLITSFGPISGWTNGGGRVSTDRWVKGHSQQPSLVVTTRLDSSRWPMGPVELLGKNDLEAAPRMNLCSVTAQKVRSRSALKKKKIECDQRRCRHIGGAKALAFQPTLASTC